MDAEAADFNSLSLLVLKMTPLLQSITKMQIQALDNQEIIAKEIGLIKHLVANMSVQSGSPESFESLQADAVQSKQRIEIRDKLTQVERKLDYLANEISRYR